MGSFCGDHSTAGEAQLRRADAGGRETPRGLFRSHVRRTFLGADSPRLPLKVEPPSNPAGEVHLLRYDGSRTTMIRNLFLTQIKRLVLNKA